MGRAGLLAWISNAANAVTDYFGQFPVPHPRVMVRPSDGRGGVFHGTTFGGRSGFTRILSTWRFQMSAANLTNIIGWRRAWRLTSSRLGRDRADESREVWGDFVRNLPQGLPRAGGQGLDHTSTWGHTYWGGAIIWLMGTLKFTRLRITRKGCGMQCAAFCGARGASGRLGDGDDGDRGFVLADEGDPGAYRSGRSVAAHGCAGESRSGNVRRSRAVS